MFDYRCKPKIADLYQPTSHFHEEFLFELQDFDDTASLLSRANVDQEALTHYTKEAANFSTDNQLPNLEFAYNQYGQADVALFDFTCM